MAKRPAKASPRGKELNDVQLQVWLAYMRVDLQLTYEMNHQLLSESELSLADYHVLSKLHQAPTQTLRMSALAQEIGWERSRASHHVRRMTERGLIATEQATKDRRGTLVTVTDRGHATYEEARRGHVALVKELFFSGLRDDLLASLTEALEHVYRNILERGSGHGG
jgi:DNA-binding MarR family transcriptional regulator